MLKRMDMVAVRVRDWPAAVDWYRDLLGFKVLHREDGDLFAVLALPEGGALLSLVGEHVVTLGTENRVMMNIAVDDLDATLQALRSRGVNVDPELDGGHGGAYRMGRIRDPEGNLIQLYWTRPPAET